MTPAAQQAHRIRTVRLMPTAPQRQLLERFAGTARFVWNWGLAERQRVYRAEGCSLSSNDQRKALTLMQREAPRAWLLAIPRRVKDGALRDLDKAYQAAFRRLRAGERAGFPHFKSRKRGEMSFEIPAETRYAHREGSAHTGRVKIVGIGWVVARGGGPEVAGAESGRFFRDRAGDWWCALVYAVPVSDARPDVDVLPVVGVHLQLQHAASLSTGETIAAPAWGAASERKLKRLQRSVSRKQTGSRNRERARVKLARAHRHVANQRTHWLHTTTTDLVRRHPRLAIQERDVRALVTDPESQRAVYGGHKRTTRILDAAWGTFSQMLVYKSAATGVPAVIVPKGEPTARTCSACGHERSSLPLTVREWECPACGAKHERGVNAALNTARLGA